MGAQCRECGDDVSGCRWMPTGRCMSCDPAQGGTLWVVVGECRSCAHNEVKCAWGREEWASAYIDAQYVQGAPVDHHCPHCKAMCEHTYMVVACRGMKVRYL